MLDQLLDTTIFTADNIEWLFKVMGGIATITIPIFLFFGGYYAWTRGKFMNWVHVAMYKVVKEDETKKLQIRTVGNRHLLRLMMQYRFAVWLILWAAQRATVNNPVLEFPVKSAWRIKNLCRGYVSSLFPDWILADNLDLPVVRKWFVVTLICEMERLHKARIGIVIVRENLMKDPEAFRGEGWVYEEGHHTNFLKMIRQIQADYLDETAAEKTKFQFLRMELGRQVCPCTLTPFTPDD